VCTAFGSGQCMPWHGVRRERSRPDGVREADIENLAPVSPYSPIRARGARARGQGRDDAANWRSLRRVGTCHGVGLSS
jgi:hypothetical protein